MTDLYIMERSDAPCIVKIGSSQDCERRRQQLESGHTFRMVLLAVFPQAGGFEHQVHRKLGNARVLTGTGREWYRMSPCEAIQAVVDVAYKRVPRPQCGQRERLSAILSSMSSMTVNGVVVVGGAHGARAKWES